MELLFIAHTYPTPDFPFFGARIAVSGLTEDLTVTRAEVDGTWMRDVHVYNDGKECRKGILRADGYAELRIRTDARNGDAPSVRVVLSDGSDFTAACPPVCENGWFLPEWKYCAAVVLDNPNSLDRVNEPVHQVMAVYLDRISDPVREVRVVAVCPETGVMREIPSQVYNISKWDGFADDHCQPTMNFDVAFLASVRGFSKAVYLVFYGNPSAEAPVYVTDLKLTGEGLKRTIENAYYKIALHDLSGSIDEVTVKQGVNQTFAHHLETNGSMNWNPDIYAPPTPWNHISDWDPPENWEFIEGPVFVMFKRWGFMPMYEDVLCSVTYTFYASYQPVIVASTMEVTKDRDVIALRNGEVVINRDLADEIAWRNMDGTVETHYVDELPRHPTMGQRLPVTTPWVVLYNREKEAALGICYIENTNIRKDRGLERIDQYLYVQVGPWIYVARPLLYTFVGNNPQRVIHAFGNTLHYEKMGWLPTRIKYNSDEAFDQFEEMTEKLRLPLQTCLMLDTDNRVPTGWVPPVLLEEFDEL
ncbi:MAG: hypothetical protein ACOXZM_05515 [Eubacteriales bacterium]|jgi:hypothetical protein